MFTIDRLGEQGLQVNNSVVANPVKHLFLQYANDAKTLEDKIKFISNVETLIQDCIDRSENEKELGNHLNMASIGTTVAAFVGMMSVPFGQLIAVGAGITAIAAMGASFRANSEQDAILDKFKKFKAVLNTRCPGTAQTKRDWAVIWHEIGTVEFTKLLAYVNSEFPFDGRSRLLVEDNIYPLTKAVIKLADERGLTAEGMVEILKNTKSKGFTSTPAITQITPSAVPTKPSLTPEVKTTIQEVKTVIQEPKKELSSKELVEKFRAFVSEYNVNVKCELADGNRGFDCAVVQKLWLDTSKGSIQEFHAALRALEETGLGKLVNGFWITTVTVKPPTPVVSDEEVQVGTERKIKIPSVKIEPQTVSLELIQNSLKDKGWISAESFVSQYGDQRPIAKKLLQTLHKEGKLEIDTKKKLLKLK